MLMVVTVVVMVISVLNSTAGPPVRAQQLQSSSKYRRAEGWREPTAAVALAVSFRKLEHPAEKFAGWQPAPLT